VQRAEQEQRRADHHQVYAHVEGHRARERHLAQNRQCGWPCALVRKGAPKSQAATPVSRRRDAGADDAREVEAQAPLGGAPKPSPCTA
jgi:hypothetical protein